uniref:Twin-arginine translocation signal domain-containing protein n=1 Tax=Roseihalotalea indica TaxID=2867963 RepID=A0AA49JKG8_9BACT|nr:twin-arginine translocation signal domain-containing protein [Tunicatimonas sp. TK19036]
MISFTQSRRHFLKTASVAGAVGFLRIPFLSSSNAAAVQTVQGSLKPSEMGVTLAHEHILVDFIGAEQVSPDRYKAEAVIEKVKPYLEKIKALGCQTFVDCTPNYLGRDVSLLQQLSEATGLHIVTNTGLYGARNGIFLPEFVSRETPQQLAQRWIEEYQNGIDGTDIRPGFIKIGVNNGPLVDYDRKLVQAAALTHRETGLTIAAHTGDAAAAMEEIQIIQEAGVHPSAFIWVHAQGKGYENHVKAAKLGAWVELDGISEESYADHARQVKALRDANLLEQVLVSCDAGWYHVGEPDGGDYRSHAVLFEKFVPEIKKLGLSAAEVDQLLVKNPAKAFVIQKKG